VVQAAEEACAAEDAAVIATSASALEHVCEAESALQRERDM
jgi:hypothetical protein